MNITTNNSLVKDDKVCFFIDAVNHDRSVNIKYIISNIKVINFYIEYLFQIIYEGSIIPFYYKDNKEKIELWSKVLFYGLVNDIDTAIHLLCPNLEDLIRKIIGKNTSVHNKKADEKTLSTLLDKEEYILKDKLGEEFLFELNYLFCKEDEGGFNLRHNVSHGLKYDMVVCYYAWWRIMKFIFIDGISLINESSKNCEK